jgi:hypothetical protein
MELTMGDQSIDLLGAGILEDTSCQSDSMTGIDHIIHQDGDFAPHISNEKFHLFNNSSLFFFVDRAVIRPRRRRWDGGDESG